MTIANEHPGRMSSVGVMSCLEEKFEIIKDIGDGSFGSVALARVRTAGANVARRGTMVCLVAYHSPGYIFTAAGRYQDNEENL